ncbi:MAG: tRNA (cytidine(34)-2'-O)-methyltransferase [Thioalkalivibrionaceae bacterium]
MFELALFEPEIPQNTGNLIRLAANTGVRLHLIEPLGFVWDDRRLRRAGLDYHETAAVSRHSSWTAFYSAIGASARVVAFSTRGHQRYDQFRYQRSDILLFGPETRGLPQALLDSLPAEQRVVLPMVEGSRSLNLANAAAIGVYEALRQQNFAGLVGNSGPQPDPQPNAQA